MKGFTKKLLSSLMVGVLLFTTSAFTAFGAESNDLIATVQKTLNNGGLNATVTEVDQAEYTSLWTEKIAPQSCAKDFLDKIQSDGYQAADGKNGVAFKVTDNNRIANTVYFVSKVFQNDIGGTVVSMFIYNPQTNSILRVYAEEVGIDNRAHLYYEYENLVLPKARDVDTVAFLCSMTGAIACASFAAMLFAFIPASIAVGMTCSTAFAYVCST